MDDQANKVLQLSAEHWNKTFCGISATDLARQMNITHEEMIVIVERLTDEGLGTLNRTVKLYEMSLSINTDHPELPVRTGGKEIVTHIFFPSRDYLTEHYFSSELVRKQLPEYTGRLHKGGSQVELIYFSDGVLQKYAAEPENYILYDSLSGGTVSSKDCAAENQSVYVRYGKRSLEGGRISVSVILKDLSGSCPEEQRHWFAHELPNASFDQNDPNFLAYVKRSFLGDWADVIAPLNEIYSRLNQINEQFKDAKFFLKTENPYLSFPFGGGYRRFCDCCSELYKLLGNDNLNQDLLKNLLSKYWALEEIDFCHESGRKLSKFELLKQLELKLTGDSRLCVVIKQVAGHRQAADHKILDPSPSQHDYVKDFKELCVELDNALYNFYRFTEALLSL